MQAAQNPALSPLPIQRQVLFPAMVVVFAVGWQVFGVGTRIGLLFLIGMGLGFSLYHASFGFAGAYRRAILDKDISGVTPQFLMLGAAMLLFAPVLAQGSAFGQPMSGAVAPASLSMALGAFLFGIGMQVAGGCASGTLYTAGGGSARMIVVLIFFCAGSFWGSLDLQWWTQHLPGLGRVSLSRELGWGIVLPLELGFLALLYLGLRLIGARNKRPLWWDGGFRWPSLLRGPWPLLLGAAMLVLLNWATLLVSGRPWSITRAFAIWGAKVAAAVGWDPATSPFWSNPRNASALVGPVLEDNVSVMNIGILLGALVAASLAGKAGTWRPVKFSSLAAAVAGGLLMGYGARLAYGCNIGAFFSGVASASLHGWIWIACALAGTLIGIRLRPLFGLDNT